MYLSKCHPSPALNVHKSEALTYGSFLGGSHSKSVWLDHFIRGWIIFKQMCNRALRVFCSPSCQQFADSWGCSCVFDRDHVCTAKTPLSRQVYMWIYWMARFGN